MRNTVLIILAGIAATGLSMLNGCASSSGAAAQQSSVTAAPVYVRVARVEHTDTDLPVWAVGKLEAKEESRLSFKIGGIVERVFVDEGQRVAKGQLLATLSLTEIDAQLAQAQNGFDKADRDLTRVKNLFADTVATLEQLQNATTAWDIAKSSLDAAAFNRRYAQIYAPSDGTVLRRLADDHEQVAAGVPIIVMTAREKGWVVRIGLADRDLMRIERGDSATVDFDALPGETVSGTVSEIGAAPNSVNGAYEVEIKIDAAPDRLLTGLIAKVSVKPSSAKPLDLVPIEALVEANGSNGFVFAPAADSRSAIRVPVTVAYVHDGKAGISGGLNGITSVITAGATKLTDGASVTVVN